MVVKKCAFFTLECEGQADAWPLRANPANVHRASMGFSAKEEGCASVNNRPTSSVGEPWPATHGSEDGVVNKCKHHALKLHLLTWGAYRVEVKGAEHDNNHHTNCTVAQHHKRHAQNMY